MLNNRSTKAAVLATTLALAISSVGGVAIADELADQTTAEVATQEQGVTEQTDAEATATETDADTTAEAGDKQEAEATQTAEDASDDVYLEAQYAELTSKSDITWVPVDVSEFSGDEWRYIEEDGYRIYYKDMGEVERIKARVKIGENGEFLAPTTAAALSTDHTSGSLFTASNLKGTHYVDSYMDADVPEDAFTQTIVDKYGDTVYYYPGGEYGAKGYYYLNTDGQYSKKHGDDRYIGMYWLFETGGDVPFSGTSAASEGEVASSVQAAEANVTYVSPTVEAAAADTASAATGATPATGDASSLAAAFVAAFGAMGAFVSAKAMRRE